jgi:hypothetical protein
MIAKYVADRRHIGSMSSYANQCFMPGLSV